MQPVALVSTGGTFEDEPPFKANPFDSRRNEPLIGSSIAGLYIVYERTPPSILYNKVMRRIAL